MSEPQAQTADHPPLIDDEVPFELSVLFFSRTDTRGVIQFGNDTFCRVSGYACADLEGKPHKIVRHPDTPRAIFRLLWQNLESGRAMGAYVRNRTRDGRYYWVFAVASPLEDGYVSVRLKPTSTQSPQIMALYDQLAREEREGLSIEDSLAKLLASLKDMGFPSYEIFAAISLMTEMRERTTRLNRTQDPALARFAAMSQAILQMEKETGEMLRAFRTIRSVPMNMRIAASRLENAGGPISAISVNYGAMLDEMTNWVVEFTGGGDSPFNRIRDALLKGLFLSHVAALQSEMRLSFGKYRGTADIRSEQDLLAQQAAKYKELAQDHLLRIERETGSLTRSVQDMKRYVTGLSSTRMMCKIESATLVGHGDALSGIVDQLDQCQAAIEARLAKMSELNNLIQTSTGALLSISGTRTRSGRSPRIKAAQ